MFGTDYIHQFLTDAKPYLKELIKEILAEEHDGGDVISVDYEEAGRMIGTTYEGIRKMVGKGDLKALKRGRRRGISVSELKSYVQRNTE